MERAKTEGARTLGKGKLHGSGNAAKTTIEK
jgi:hypothetical protein